MLSKRFFSTNTLRLQPNYKIDGNCIRWIINYRQAKMDKDYIIKVADQDGHSGGSWEWTKHQSEYIDNHGWESWLLHEQRSAGYRSFLETII